MSPTITGGRDIAQIDLRIYQGDEFSQQLRFKADDAYVDLTGFAGRAQIRRNPSASDVIATMTVTFERALVADGFPADDAVGVATVLLLSIDDAVTASIGPGTYMWDLELTPSGGAGPTTWARGRVLVKPQVTR